MTTFKKDPNAILDYTFDWGPYLTPLSDQIATATFILTGTLTKASQSNTTTTATAFIAGGTEGSTESLTCRIVTVGGRTDDRTISLKIVNR